MRSHGVTYEQATQQIQSSSMAQPAMQLARSLRRQAVLERRKVRLSLTIANEVLRASTSYFYGGAERGSASTSSLPPVSGDVACDSLSAALNINGTRVFTSVDELRQAHGTRRNWFGDLDAPSTRALYHSLLPTTLIEMEELPLATRARIAVQARHAARVYARERALLPVALPCQLFDGVRQLIENGRFQPNGMSEEQVFSKYAERYGLPANWGHDEEALDEELYTRFYSEVLSKSCTTNPTVDELADSLAAGNFNLLEHAAQACGFR